MGSHTVIVAAIALYACAATAHAAFTPIADAPYTEHVSTRFIANDAKIQHVEGWGNLATHGVYDVAIGKRGGVDGVYFLSPDGLFFLDFSAGPKPDAVTHLAVSGDGAQVCVAAPGGKLAATDTCSIVLDDATGEVQALASPSMVAFVKCSDTASSCSTTSSVVAAFGSVNSTATSPSALWIGAASGLWVVPASATAAVQLLDEPVWSVAYGALDDILAAGNSQKLYFYHAKDTTAAATALAIASGAAPSHRATVGVVAVEASAAATTLQPFRWEWVTIVPSGTGGVVDNMITGMAFDVQGRLYVANPTCLNVRARNGSFSRVAGLQGLPYNHLRAVAVGTGSDKYQQQVWLASDMGASLWNRFDNPANTWRYFFGPRYHPGTVVVDIASSGDFTVLATDGGLAVIEDQQWTLQQKAAHMEVVLARHNRLVGPPGLVGGLIASCGLASFGNYSSCHNADSDNNGLWTSLVVAAEAMRYAVTGEAEAQELAIHYFNGMRFLNLVTGVKGLMARSVVATGTTHQNGAWHNSTAYPGWTWKGDTSSDEVTGHMFAYPIVHDLVKNDTVEAEALQLASNIVSYITDNGFTLVDVTGRPTTWGHWDPAYLNGNRSWSDGRGVNSLQMLGYLSAGYVLTQNDSYSAAYAELCNSTNQYGENLLNLKIEAPCDDNYSDDELTFLPYYTWFKHGATTIAPFNNIDQAYASLNRTFDFVRPWRSDLWNAITVAITGDGDADVMESIAWNLRSWPLEQVVWPVHNSNRTDIRFRPAINRFGKLHTQSVKVLPANERDQFLWNANPHTLDGGSGMSEADPGAWLLPYWLARYHGLLSAPALAL